MADPNATMTREEARQTRVQRAVERQKEAHTGRAETMGESAIRNLVGLAALIMGTLRTTKSMNYFDELAKNEKGVSVAAVIVLSIGVLLFVFGCLALAPKPMLTFLRVLGLNGLADKLTSLLPGGKRA